MSANLSNQGCNQGLNEDFSEFSIHYLIIHSNFTNYFYKEKAYLIDLLQ